MEIRYKVIGSRRKAMAHKIAEITGQECRYLFLPTYAYEIGDFNLAKRTCKMIQGELVLPSTPTVTGYPSYNACVCPQAAPAGA